MRRDPGNLHAFGMTEENGMDPSASLRVTGEEKMKGMDPGVELRDDGWGIERHRFFASLRMTEEKNAHYF